MAAPSTVDLQQYHRWVCEGFASSIAVRVPFRGVSIGDWTPSVAHCHDNVDRWVRHHPSAKAVRGWAWQGGDGVYSTVLAHSVVRKGRDWLETGRSNSTDEAVGCIDDDLCRLGRTAEKTSLEFRRACLEGAQCLDPLAGR